MTLHKKYAIATAFAAACAGVFASQHAEAQIPIDPDSIAIVQNDRVVGEVFRGLTDPPSPDVDPPSPDHYVEHWVLYPGYVYPNARNGVTTDLVPGYHTYKDVKTFLATVPFSKGSRYVKVDCADGTTIPGR